jgi:cyclopropane fatty-acyl-phospholipid synthase-like methyltransferase
MTRLFAGLLALLLACAGSAHAQHSGEAMHHSFGGAEEWAKVFDDPARDAWQKPDEVLRALALAPGAKVADIGSGTGYFSVRLARAVPQGRVYGADLEPDMVRHLNHRAAHENLPNLRSIVAAPDDPKLPEPVDLALFVDVYHHIGSRERYFANLRAALRPGGRVAIVDFKPDSPEGPPAHFRVTAEQVKAQMKRSGYRLADDHGFLPYQYFLVFTPARP